MTPDLQAKYDEYVAGLESWPGWQTHRKNPPVLILGERGGIELGLRQLRRAVPLRTTRLRGLVVPSPAETLRIKAFLLSERRATRDYLDVAALIRQLGEEGALAGLACLNLLYPTTGSQTCVTRFAEGCAGTPVDFDATPLEHYKGLIAPFNDWAFVSNACGALGRQLLKLELRSELPMALPPGFA